MTTLLVDGNNLLSRADFAAKGKRVEMSADGFNTAALVIFVNMLSKYSRLVGTDRMLVCWDAGHDFRDEAYPEYKSARKKHDGEGTSWLFETAQSFLSIAGIPDIWVNGYEADDLIAVATRAMVQPVVILSGDKDLLQLVCDRSPHGLIGSVTQIRVPDDDPWDRERVREKFGVHPEHLPYYLALVGDPGDGVPGVAGIGPKKAVALLEKAGWDWEALVDLLGPEKGAQAVLMRSLVDLRYHDYPEHLTDAGWAAVFEPPIGPQDGRRWSQFVGFCDRFDLNSIRERAEAGRLWAGSSPDMVEVFAGLDDTD